MTLLGILLVSVLWRHVLDDAICLVILVALFLVASGMTLGVVAPSGLDICLIIGVICVGLGGIKLWVLHSAVGMTFRIPSLIGVFLILIWNFLGSSLMARPLMALASTDEIRRNQWTWGWLLLLGGTTLVWIDAIHTTYTSAVEDKERPPFLQHPAMVWLFVLVLWVGSGFHQYGIAYMLAIDYQAGDFLPWMAIGMFLLVEWIRSLGKSFGHLELGLLLLPLFAVLWAMYNGKTVLIDQIDSGLFYFPPLILGACGMATLVITILHSRPRGLKVTAAYGLGTLLTFNPSHSFNWLLAGIGLISMLILLGILRRQPLLCLLGLVGVALGLTQTSALATWAPQYGLTMPSLIAGFTGLGTLIVVLGFGTLTPRWMTTLGSVLLGICIYDYLPKSLNVVDLFISAYVSVLFLMLVLRTRTVRAALPLWLPLGPRVYLLVVGMSSWAFVVLSFILLFLGAGISLFWQHRP